MFPEAPWTGIPLPGVNLGVLVLLVLYLLLVEPRLGERFFAAFRRAGTEPGTSREGWFRRLVAMQAGFLVLTLGLILLLPGVTFDNTGIREGRPPSGVLLGIIAGGLLGVAAAVAVAWKDHRPAGGSTPALPADLELFLPRSPRERGWLVAVAVGAGTSEEVLYRGLLPALLVATGMPVPAAVATQAVLFGMAHRYQGWTGLIGTGIIGLALGALTAHTGSLLLPVILHVAIDLKLALMPGAPGPSLTSGHQALMD